MCGPAGLRPLATPYASAMTPSALTQHDFQDDLDAIARIDAIPLMLDVLCRTTGMRFAAVARVTEDRWIACQVRDDIEFGLGIGGELKVETTICQEVRDRRARGDRPRGTG